MYYLSKNLASNTCFLEVSRRQTDDTCLWREGVTALMSFYNPEPPKRRKKWSEIPQTPIIPVPLSNASDYRLSTFTPVSPDLLSTPSEFQVPHIPHTQHPTVLASPFQDLHLSNQYPDDPCSSAQNRARPVEHTPFERMEIVLECCKENFDSIGQFFDVLFHNSPRDTKDPRSTLHISMLSAFLGGRCNFRAIDLVKKMYLNRFSIPHKRSKRKDELHATFDPNIDPHTLHYARPAMSIWALQLVGSHCRTEIESLAHDDPDEPLFRVYLAASANARVKASRSLVGWNDLWGFSMQGNVLRLSRRVKASWYLSECMAATRKRGVVIVRKHRPHPFVQAAAISSFVMCRNKYANGYMALVMDLKRVYCRLGLIVSDTTVRHALNSMTDTGRTELQQSISNNIANQGDLGYCMVIDNVQQYVQVHEPGIGRVNQLEVGTAATVIRLEDYEPGAFNLDEYQTRVIKNERSSLTTEDLYNDIDWKHIHKVTSLHFARVLCEFIPQLNHLCPEISKVFRAPPVAQHRMRDGRKTWVQPLGTNAEREIETKGMKQCLLDFDAQMAIKGEATAGTLLWACGDGGSFAAAHRLKKYLLPTDHDVYKTFQNRLFTIELWHSKSTNLNTTATNFYGPKTSKDPSALSHCASATNMHRPPNTQSCNFYPTARSMQLFWEAHILDIWSLHLADHKDILSHFNDLAIRNSLPTLDTLLGHAEILVKRYASTTAADLALSLSDDASVPETYKIPLGKSWISQVASSEETVDQDGSEKDIPFKEDGFIGDRILANSMLYLRDFSWWVEMVYAIADGDIGRAFAVLKIWIFTFAGASNQNYVNYLLETYCLFKFEASKSLRDALWNNWLVNLTGELGNWIECDLLQEHYNRWLEDMVGKHGGKFDDSFYRQTISPNVHCFLRIKEEFEAAFELGRRSKSHTSPHLRDEYKILLTIFREEQVHKFRSTRSMGHAAVDLLNQGYVKLNREKLPDFLKKSTEQAVLLSKWKDDKDTSFHESPAANPPPPSGTSTTSPNSEIDLADTDHNDHTRSDCEAGSDSEHEATDEVEAEESEDEQVHEAEVDDIPTSGSDLTFIIDSESGRLINDWYDEGEFVAIVEDSGLDAETEQQSDESDDGLEVDAEESRYSSEYDSDN
ncbi:hypothetical protein ARMGADRAFT_1105106 [Armillaria gallica]|uniref:DUF6589 domain-containing protein n=1 Tax=Armillaria gallica TaxID=47427 RepID=A0A2H3DAU2_ARMGA|nr:hypothetical protein ARMGADRAFT_1105106 [Armillaria gallica]